MRTYIIAAALALATAGVVQPASAADLYYVTGPASMFAGYTLPFMVVAEGDTLTFVNLDGFQHDVISRAMQPGTGDAWCAEAGFIAPGSCPLFWSSLIGVAALTPVLGMDNVVSGETYDFFCSIHANMEGTLVVLP